MKPFIIFGLLIIFPLLHSCGMFGGAEPEITKEEPAVTDSSVQIHKKIRKLKPRKSKPLKMKNIEKKLRQRKIK